MPKLRRHTPGKHSPHTRFSPDEYYTWNNWWRVYRLANKMKKPSFEEFQEANTRRGDAGFVNGAGISYADESIKSIYSRLSLKGNCAPAYVLKYCKDPYSGKNLYLQKPDPKLSARDIDKRVVVALKALETTNKGKYAERTGVSNIVGNPRGGKQCAI